MAGNGFSSNKHYQKWCRGSNPCPGDPFRGHFPFSQDWRRRLQLELGNSYSKQPQTDLENISGFLVFGLPRQQAPGWVPPKMLRLADGFSVVLLEARATRGRFVATCRACNMWTTSTTSHLLAKCPFIFRTASRRIATGAGPN